MGFSIFSTWDLGLWTWDCGLETVDLRLFGGFTLEKCFGY